MSADTLAAMTRMKAANQMLQALKWLVDSLARDESRSFIENAPQMIVARAAIAAAEALPAEPARSMQPLGDDFPERGMA